MEIDSATQLKSDIQQITLNLQKGDKRKNHECVMGLNNNIENFYQRSLNDFITSIDRKHVKHINNNQEVHEVHRLKDDVKNYLLFCVQSDFGRAKKWYSFFVLLSNKNSDKIVLGDKENDDFPQRISELLQKNKSTRINNNNNNSQQLAPIVSKVRMGITIVNNCPGLSQALFWATKQDNQLVDSFLSCLCDEQTHKNITTQYFPLIQEIGSKKFKDSVQLLDNFLNTQAIKETINIACTNLDLKPSINQYNMLQKHTLVTLLKKMRLAYLEINPKLEEPIDEDFNESNDEGFESEDEFCSLSSDEDPNEEYVSISSIRVVDNGINKNIIDEDKILNNDNSSGESPVLVKKNTLISYMFYGLCDIYTEPQY